MLLDWKKEAMHFRRIFFMLLFSSIALFVLSIYYVGLKTEDPRLCFIAPPHIGVIQPIETTSQSSTTPFPKLLDDVLLSQPQPQPGKSIFFHETSCRWLKQSRKWGDIFNVDPRPAHFNLVELTARQACAIESAALFHPNLSVFVLFTSPAYYWGEEFFNGNANYSGNAILNAILSYNNVYLRNLNLWNYATDTPLEEWLNSAKLFESQYVLSHVSDFLRYLTLWRYGGTYLDMDIIVKRSLDDLPPNYTGAESYEDLAAGIMNFEPDGYGHRIAEACLNDFKQNFNGYDWGNNGPGVITRTLKKLCNATSIAEMLTPQRCRNFHVYKPEVFYAIPWRHWRAFFDARNTTSTMKKIEESYIVHVWNKHSHQWRLPIHSQGAYELLAKKYCPRVYASLTDYF